MPLLDTRRGRDLTGTLIADIVLQLLSYVAQTEREFIRQRQAEGIAAAKARGVHCGRREGPLPPAFEESYVRWRQKEISVQKAAEICGMPCSTFFYRAKKYEKESYPNDEKNPKRCTFLDKSQHPMLCSV